MIKRPSISYREVHRTKAEALASKQKWMEEIREMNKNLPKGWGKTFLRVRPIKTTRAMRKRSLTPFPSKKRRR